MRKIKRVLLFFLTLFVISGCEKITDTVILPPDTSQTEPLTVMTYNVYLGASAVDLLSVDNLLQVPEEVENMYNNVMASDFPSRAAAISKSIKTYQPHLIGLQEVTLIRRQSPGDYIEGGTVPAEEVVLDFLEILMDTLQAEGLEYHVAADIENIDVEMPMFTDTGIDDVRLTDYDVILARSDVEISRPMRGNYENALTIERLRVAMKRGYVAVDATVSGVTYRVVNTHLEPFSVEDRIAQIQELVDVLSNETLPMLLLGDFNFFGDAYPLDFNTDATQTPGYQHLRSAGYVDTWQMDAEASGNTCCQDADILNEISQLSIRIDMIFLRNLQRPMTVVTQTLGDKPSDRLPSKLWPSDHAGVVAQIAFE